MERRFSFVGYCQQAFFQSEVVRSTGNDFSAVNGSPAVAGDDCDREPRG